MESTNVETEVKQRYKSMNSEEDCQLEENYEIDSDIELGNAHKKAYGLQDIMKNTLFKMRNFST